MEEIIRLTLQLLGGYFFFIAMIYPVATTIKTIDNICSIISNAPFRGLRIDRLPFGNTLFVFYHIYVLFTTLKQHYYLTSKLTPTKINTENQEIAEDEMTKRARASAMCETGCTAKRRRRRGAHLRCTTDTGSHVAKASIRFVRKRNSANVLKMYVEEVSCGATKQIRHIPNLNTET